MVVVIIGMLVCIVLALIVVGLVALPARRQGEALFIDRSHARTAAGLPAEPQAESAASQAEPAESQAELAETAEPVEQGVSASEPAASEGPAATPTTTTGRA